MLRRTALILTGFLLLSLAVSIGYALFGLGGPEHTIELSRQALRSENFLEAIRLADLALRDRALDRNNELRRQALRVRYQAYARVGDHRHALADLAELIETLRDRDLQLVLSRIWITLGAARRTRDMSQAREALEQCRTVLAEQPENGTALALAGDACRALYEEQLLKLRQQLRGSLSPQRLQSVMAKLTDNTFRSKQDPRLAGLEQELQTLLPERRDQHPELRNQIRTWVQRGQEYFLRALSLEHPPVRAYLGLDNILASTGRDEQRLALAEIYKLRATPGDVLTATAVATRLHLRAGRYHACVRTADRVAAPDAWRRLARSKAYGPQIQPILLAKHLALARLGANGQRRKSAAEVAAMVPAMPMGWPLYDLIQGVALAGLEDRQASSHLQRFAGTRNLPALALDHWTRRELLRVVYETRVEVERRLGTDPAAIAGILGNWSHRDPTDPRPLVQTARLWLEAGRLGPAVAAAAHALRLAEEDDEVLGLYARTALAAVEGGPRDLPELLQRCQRLQKPVPDNIGDMPVLALPLAEHALGTGHLRIASACARMAADHYPWARRPRYLVIEAALEAGRPQDAIQDLEVLLRYHPGDRRANELLGKVLAGDPKQARTLRFASAVYGAPNPGTARFLARRLDARGEWDRVLALSRKASKRFPPDAELMSAAARVLLHRGQQETAGQLLAAIHRLPGQSPWALGQLILWNPTNLSPEFRAQLLWGYLEAIKDPQEGFALARQLRDHGEHGLAHQAANALVQDERFEEQRTAAWFQLAGRTALQLRDLDQAREHLVAAAGFGDGRAAALDLTLLHLAQNHLAAARETFRLSQQQGLAAACVAARLGHGDAALARIRYRLEADPEHLPSLCVLAVLDPDAKVPAEVRALARAAGNELVELVAFLSSDAFFGTALRRATALAKKHPENPVAVLLGLRAFVRAGRHQEVLSTLLSLKLESPALRGEALRILNASDSPELRSSQLMNRLLDSVVSQGASAHPALLSVVVRHDMRLLAEAGERAAALKATADFWIRYPRLAGADLDDVDLLVSAGMHDTALQLLEVIEPGVAGADRQRFLRTFYEVAAKIVAAKPHLAKSFMDGAHEVLTQEGPHGTVLHFLLEARDAREPWPEDPEARADRRQEEIGFLRAHVEHYHAGLDRDRDSYLKSLARLFLLEDPEQGLERMEQALRDDPSLLDLWGYRARRLLAQHRLDDAISGLAWIPAYLEDPATEEILLPLRLRRDGSIEPGKEPGSSLARGLVALYRMDFAAAAKALAQARPQVDGSHLFYLALARLGECGPEARQAAAACFRELASQYPASPLTFLAPEFAAWCRP